MTITAGALSLVSVGSNTAVLSATAASGGTAPYMYQWYRSTSTGFSPGAGNIIAGATSLSLSDSGLIPVSTMYYKVVATDAAAATVTYTQLAVTTTATQLSQNVVYQSPIVGSVQEPYSTGTFPVQIDFSQSGPLYPGDAVKFVNSAGGVPKVIGCSANSDEVYGFLNYNLKNIAYQPGNAAEVSAAGNVIYLYATGAIARGDQVTLDVSQSASVRDYSSASSGDNIVGYAMDQAAGFGSLIRVVVRTPSFLFHA